MEWNGKVKYMLKRIGNLFVLALMFFPSIGLFAQVLPPLPPPPQMPYTFQEFNVAGARYTVPLDLNDFNYGVGYAAFNDGTRDILFNVLTRSYWEIKVPGACMTNLNGLNNLFQIVGIYGVGACSPDGKTETHMFFRDSDGTIHNIHIDSKFGTNGFPEGINDDGTVGGSIVQGGEQRGFVMRCGKKRGGFACSDPTIFEGPGDRPFLTRVGGVNNKEQTSGEVLDHPESNRQHGFVCDKRLNCSLIDFLGALGTSVSGMSRTKVAGFWYGNDGITHSMLCAIGGKCSTIDPVSLGGRSSSATDVNVKGLIIGIYSDTFGTHGYVGIPNSSGHDDHDD